jgi:hypothetical protein
MPVVLALLCAPLTTPYARPVGDALSLHWRCPARQADTGARPICNICHLLTKACGKLCHYPYTAHLIGDSNWLQQEPRKC